MLSKQSFYDSTVMACVSFLDSLHQLFRIGPSVSVLVSLYFS